MRKRKSLMNMGVAFLSYILTIIFGMIAQVVFIDNLGTEYLGLNGLFTNVIAMLGIAELGIGNAIIYNLYKPIAKNDIEQVKSLMIFYKNCYRVVAIIVFTIGILLIPFLSFFVGKVTVPVNITFIYLLFLIDIVCSYLLSYKRSILFATQNNYIINLTHIGYTIITNILQIIILIFTKNYYLYLGIKIITRLLENIAISYIANTKYSYILDKNYVKLDKKTKKDILKKIKALFFHKIGGFVVLGSDNIIISKFLGLVSVGLYSNYYMIINAIQSIFGQVMQATTASIGNMLVTENKDKYLQVFQKIRFLNFWISCFASISILVIMQSFIVIWIGKEYLLSTFVLMILVLNLFQKLMRYSFSNFKEAAGIFYEDRFVPLVEATLNIIASIILCKWYGLAGVFIGTVISDLALWCYSYPKYVYKKLFDRNYIEYAKETIGYIILFVLIASGTYYLSTIINFSNIYLEFISNVIISLIVPNALLFIIFFKTDNFKYYSNLLKNLIKRTR